MLPRSADGNSVVPPPGCTLSKTSWEEDDQPTDDLITRGLIFHCSNASLVTVPSNLPPTLVNLYVSMMHVSLIITLNPSHVKFKKVLILGNTFVFTLLLHRRDGLSLPGVWWLWFNFLLAFRIGPPDWNWLSTRVRGVGVWGVGWGVFPRFFGIFTVLPWLSTERWTLGMHALSLFVYMNCHFQIWWRSARANGRYAQFRKPHKNNIFSRLIFCLFSPLTHNISQPT